METRNSPSDSPHRGINYLYFGAYFALIVLISAISVLMKENLSGSRIFFFLYAAGQAALETSVLIFLGAYIRRYLGKLPCLAFIGATFLLLLLHVFDFLMDRILDLSIWETIGFVLDEDFHNFFYLLEASGVPLWTWGLGFALIALIPLFGIFIYRLAESFTDKKPLPFYPERFLLAFFCLPMALLFWDFSASRIIHPDAYTAFLQSLPWKSTFLEPKTVVLPIASRLRAPLEEKKMEEAIASTTAVPAKRPNIYLFVVESLRRDIITQDTAPHLHAFGKEVVSFDYTLSNANGTNLAWMSIFHSQFAYHWNRLRKSGWEMGSPPLALLKKWGYRIHVYTSAELGYYGLEQLLFGKGQRLLDSYQTFHHTPPSIAADGDAEALAKLQKDMAEDPSLHEGQVFIVFWDSTHFDYNWPKNWTPKFTPFASDFAYVKGFYSRATIELIKNRYRNAVSHLDFLFGQFLHHLPNKEESIVVFTGDHGEEFLEHGHLFHNSHLSQEQTHIPLFMKFGNTKPPTGQRLTSQIDIFPSIIDYLSGQECSFLEGQSVFAEKRWPYAVVFRFNASRNPYEFYIHNGRNKFIARFPNRSNILASESLQIRSLRTADDRTILNSPKDVRAWVQQEFGPGIDHLFEKE
jgi:hypothetical protein